MRWHRDDYAMSRLDEEDFGRLSMPGSKKFENFSQFTLRKFHLFTGFVFTGSMGLTGVIRQGLWCISGKGSLDQTLWQCSF